MASTDPLVWIDCEMTGLDPDSDTIMSIACFITDAELNLYDDKGFEVVIHHEQEDLDRMGQWCTEQHGKSGLTQACLESTTSATQAATDLLAYIQNCVPRARVALLAGNSVHADKSFLAKPPYKAVVDYLHYRILDVSSIMEGARRWAPELVKGAPKKLKLHDAREDILESIQEARYYRDTLFWNNR
ncbi:oligoribonuclease-like protein [Polyplosphaeria fusca]|uniref:Oligoribonuclease-like protein n=1 Tax=Polyplosphaeria fusca TaxID=682080 RepID=A0A9P4QKJ6_9PLEO|nr:oligoribonuclease-like protein [Polyplosphaeria fusca]